MGWGIRQMMYDHGKDEPPRSCEEKIINAEAVLMLFGSLVLLGSLWVAVTLAQLVRSGQVSCVSTASEMTALVLEECKQSLDMVVILSFLFCFFLLAVMLLCRMKLHEEVVTEES